ncbi:hypothetical protein [Paraburkholderia sp. DHOC27]|uniref:hypothetical protein n=1 Tax=Paraburkholderia sp. DHOC27 TaxID=2303330 RepID=UPI0011C1314A|nr:hypothetical protein [Paraburkholderia sp. DHOC27]
MAEETAGSTETILQCTGAVGSKGIDAPADVALGKPVTGAVGTYIITTSSVMIISDGSSFANTQLPRCRETSTQYTYSNDCGALRPYYMQDWMHATDFDRDTGSFFKKYRNSAEFLQTVVIDRLTLHLTDEMLVGFTRVDRDKSTQKITQKPYMTSGSYDADCHVTKPKI